MNEKFFNTAGPCVSKDHYMVDPLRRVDFGEIMSLISQKRYFVLHAPRQTGKTTSLLAMVSKINGEGDFHCAYMNVEAAQTARNDVSRGMSAILSRLRNAVKGLSPNLPEIDPGAIFADNGPDAALIAALEGICEALSKPLVLFIDEIDALVGDVLVSVLRQLRTGYADRPRSFPTSVVLCGVRDVRDYRIRQSDGEIITGGSCFNIKAESLRLGDFSPEEIKGLYGQHTEETGQAFEEGVYPAVWRLTHGQPWLTNALARQATAKIPEGRDRGNDITPGIIERAAEALILERATHLDQLADKLREDRVRRVIGPMIAGEHWPQGAAQPREDDIQYAIDLGLIRRGGPDGKNLVISNGMYMEVIPRELTAVMQDNLASRAERPWYAAGDGSLDVPGLLRGFQQFFRENAGSWLGDYEYREAGFQLMLQAFLQRVVNGGGLIAREYALGSGRVDLLVRWRYPAREPRSRQKEQKVALELKTIRKNRAPDAVLAEGLEQIARYADASDATEAHLVICDQRPGRSWDEKVYERAEKRAGRVIQVWGM